MVMDMAMVTMEIMARDPLMLSLLPLLNQLLMPNPLLLLMLSLLLLLSPDMDMVMDMAMDILAMDMAMDMDMVIMDIMARDLLSQDMDIMAMDMDMDMDMVMAMVMDTTAKQICCSFSEFSTNEVGPYRSSQKHTILISKKINIEKRKK